MISGKVSPSTFEWSVPIQRVNNLLLRHYLKENVCIFSPDFHLQDSSWYLKLYFTEPIEICLSRRDSGCPKIITYTIKFYSRTDVKEFTKTCHFGSNSESSTGRTILIKDLASLHSDLLITCYIKGGTPRLASGNELVSCAVRTKLPVCKSCAIQTEVANSVIEKENLKDEDWSSLDVKDDALLRERMKELLTKGKDHDVTICVQDKDFRAHRSILSTRSPVFAMMLSHDTKENNTGTISIEDCDPESFDEFLLYVYSGRAENLTPSNALQLYHPADKYDFPVLKERCVSLLKTSLSVESICDVVLLATRHHEKGLLEVATEFFARNIKKIVVTVGWQKFMIQNPVEANELIVKTMETLLPEN